MQPELTLNTKCPACGAIKPKTLAAIQTQAVFECDCGFHAQLQNTKATLNEQIERAQKAPATI